MDKAEMGPERVRIVIPCRGAAAALERTLRSLAAQDARSRRLTIVVANDGGDPGVTEVCRRHGVSMVAIQPPRGSYFARSRALERCSGDPVIFLDAGIDVPPGWLAAALRVMGDADYLACEVDIAEVPAPTAAEEYERAHSYPVAEYVRISHFGVTAGLVVSRRLLQAAGSFDERLRSGGDLEFGDRVHRAGWHQGYMASPVLLHPPRRAMAFLRKQFRVKIGYGHLTRLYPGRFPGKGVGTCLAHLFRSLPPPHPAYIRSEFPPGTTVPACRRFGFLWVLKICRAAAELAAALLPAPSPRRPPPRVEWSDFTGTDK